MAFCLKEYLLYLHTWIIVVSCCTSLDLFWFNFSSRVLAFSTLKISCSIFKSLVTNSIDHKQGKTIQMIFQRNAINFIFDVHDYMWCFYIPLICIRHQCINNFFYKAIEINPLIFKCFCQIGHTSVVKNNPWDYVT